MLVTTSYAYPWSDLITRYKFGDQPGWAGFFASLLMGQAPVRQALAELAPGDLIIPMPLSAERLQSRGFNQARELARVLATQSASPGRLHAQLLLRTRDTRPQTELKREARLANVKGAFQLDPLQAQLVSGRQVVLVDDVVTSGASIFTAARVLREAGARRITGVAIAKTDLD
ncbi:MAG: ComF family protein [Pseudomonadota bacterium]